MSGETLLETERLRLEGWREDQLDDLVRLHGDPEIAQYLSDDGKAWTVQQCADGLALWIDNFKTHRMGKLRLIRKSDGAFIGRAGFGFYPPTGEPEIGYALFREHRGQGYATEAANALRDWIFRATDWDHFIGFADVRNHASLAVLRRIGMVPTHTEETMGFEVQFHVLRKADAA
jgi:RimJ/RimL family protein N-acetyltransferase